MTAPSVPQALPTRDWFLVEDWNEVYARTGIAPRTLPGVRTAADHPVADLAPRTDPAFAKQAGASARDPYPHVVHRSHLPVLGLAAPAVLPVSTTFTRSGPVLVDFLRPYQTEGAAFIRARRGSLISDECRCGKTAQVVYGHDPASGPLVVVGPVSSRAAWHEWAARRFGTCADTDGTCPICARFAATRGSGRAPESSFANLAGRTPDVDLIRGSEVYFLTYAVIGPWSEQFSAFGKIGTLVADEAHLAGVCNRRNVTAVAMKRLSTVAHRVVYSSGSPLWNKPAGLWPIVDTICPAAFGDYWAFAIRHAGAKPGAHGWSANGSTNEEELRKRLSAIMIRRTWREIQSNLPPITRSLEYVDLSAEDHAAVYEAVAGLRKAVDAGKAQTVVGNLERLRKIYASYKIRRAVEILQQTVADGHSVIAWCWHRDVADTLAAQIAKEGLRAYVIHGGTPPAARDALLDDVRREIGRVVLIATMGALGTGLSLNFASHEVFVELDWTPANIAQAEMRPFDGTRPISSIFLVADCDPDRRQAAAIFDKLQVASGLGLAQDVGVADLLRSAFDVGGGKTLDDVAALIIEGERA